MYILPLVLINLKIFRAEDTDLNPNPDDVSKKLRVTHFDCGEMSQNTLYALHHVEQCKIAPENLEVSVARISLYTKHFRKTINATMCSLKVQTEQWHCGHHDHSSIDFFHPGITSDVTLSLILQINGKRT